MRARSRSNSVRADDLWSSGTQRSESAGLYGEAASVPSTPGIAKENSFTGLWYAASAPALGHLPRERATASSVISARKAPRDPRRMSDRTARTVASSR